MSRPSKYVDRTTPRVGFCDAHCKDCNWTHYGKSGLERVQEAARYHVREHAHRVLVRSSRIVTYKPKAPA